MISDRDLLLEILDGGVVVDLYLSYRAVKASDDMVRVQGRMPPAESP